MAFSLGILGHPGNWAAKSAKSWGIKSLVPLLAWNSIARNDLSGWTNWRLGGILCLEESLVGMENHIQITIKTSFVHFIIFDQIIRTETTDSKLDSHDITSFTSFRVSIK